MSNYVHRHRVVSTVSTTLSLFLAGCGGEEPRILNIYGAPESTGLELVIDTCNQKPQVEIAESPDEIHLTVTAAKVEGNGRNDCADNAEVNLAEPLGDRRVIDNATGESLDVERQE